MEKAPKKSKDPQKAPKGGEPVCSTCGRARLGALPVFCKGTILRQDAGFSHELHVDHFYCKQSQEHPHEQSTEEGPKPGSLFMTMAQRTKKAVAAQPVLALEEASAALVPDVPPEESLSVAVSQLVSGGSAAAAAALDLGGAVGVAQGTACLLGSWTAALSNTGVGGTVAVSWDAVDVEGALLICNLTIEDSRGKSVTLAMPLQRILEPHVQKRCNWGCLVESLGPHAFPLFIGADALAVPSSLLSSFGPQAVSVVWRLWNSGGDRAHWAVFSRADSLLVVSAEQPTSTAEFERAARAVWSLPDDASLCEVHPKELICYAAANIDPEQENPRVLRLSGVKTFGESNCIYVEDCLRQGAHMALSAVHEDKEDLPVLYSVVAPEPANPCWRVLRRANGEVQASVIAKWAPSGWLEAKTAGKKKNQLFNSKVIKLEELGQGGWQAYSSPGAYVALNKISAQEAVEQLTRKKGLKPRAQSEAPAKTRTTEAARAPAAEESGPPAPLSARHACTPDVAISAGAGAVADSGGSHTEGAVCDAAFAANVADGGAHRHNAGSQLTGGGDVEASASLGDAPAAVIAKADWQDALAPPPPSLPRLSVGVKVLAWFYGDWHAASIRRVYDDSVEVLWATEWSISVVPPSHVVPL